MSVLALIEQLMAELKAEVLAELRADVHAETDSSTWPGWMSVPTAAAYLDVTPGRLRKLIAARAIPFAQEAVGCRISLNRHDLDLWMRTHTHERRTS